MAVEPRVDIIIPAYNAQDTIIRTLSSIASQTIIKDCDITIVNDGDKVGYEKFVKMFSPFMSIREIKLEKNGGPGVARQKGLEETKNPFVTFIDADDSFYGAFAIEILRKNLWSELDQYHTVIGAFVEEQPNLHFEVHKLDTVWVFGKMYFRNFLKKYDIHFNDTRANEDNGFNMQIKLCSSENEKIKFIADTVYIWHSREDSITRKNNCEYSYNQSFDGYTDNMIYAIKHAESKKPFSEIIQSMKLSVMINLYQYFLEGAHRDPRFTDKNWGYCQKFYNEIYFTIKDKVTSEMFASVYNDVMKNSFNGNKFAGFIPAMGIFEFMEKLEAERVKSVESVQEKK